MATDAEILAIAKSIRSKRKIVRVKKNQLTSAESTLADAEAELKEET